MRQDDISAKQSRDIVARIKAGRLALIALHSAHSENPFVAAMNERTREGARSRYPNPANGPPVKFEFVPPRARFVTTVDSIRTPAYCAMQRGNQLTVRVDLPNCVFPAYRPDGKPSTVKVLKPDHPISARLPAAFEILQTEMYADPFHVPEPDEVLFEVTWEAGESFRSGLIWNIGSGKVFYFRPGHETLPVYKQDQPLRIISNAVHRPGQPIAKQDGKSSASDRKASAR